MRKGRSPNYPQLTVAEAVEKARAVFTAEHFHAATREVVAADMGYQSLNGTSLTAIGALRHYGLLENEGDKLHVTDDAVSLVELSREEPNWHDAFLRVAFRPPLFAEMAREFGDTLPSEANLRHWLLKKGFLSKASDEVIRIYRENLDLAPDALKRYDWGVGPVMTAAPNTERPMNTQAAIAASGVRISAEPQVINSWVLSPSAKAELKLMGEITAEDLETLRDYVEITIKALGRKAKALDPES